MSANKSHRQFRAFAMTAEIAHHVESELFVECAGCRRRESVRLNRFPPGETIGRVVGRLKRQRSGVLPWMVVLTDAGLWRQVRLVGPG